MLTKQQKSVLFQEVSEPLPANQRLLSLALQITGLQTEQPEQNFLFSSKPENQWEIYLIDIINL